MFFAWPLVWWRGVEPKPNYKVVVEEFRFDTNVILHGTQTFTTGGESKNERKIERWVKDDDFAKEKLLISACTRGVMWCDDEIRWKILGRWSHAWFYVLKVIYYQLVVWQRWHVCEQFIYKVGLRDSPLSERGGSLYSAVSANDHQILQVARRQSRSSGVHWESLGWICSTESWDSGLSQTSTT